MQQLIRRLVEKFEQVMPAAITQQPTVTGHAFPKCKARLPGESVDDYMFTPGYIHEAGDRTLRNPEGELVFPGAKVYVTGMYLARNPRSGYQEPYQSLEIEYQGLYIPAYRRAGLDSGYPITQDPQRKVHYVRTGRGAA